MVPADGFVYRSSSDGKQAETPFSKLKSVLKENPAKGRVKFDQADQERRVMMPSAEARHGAKAEGEESEGDDFHAAMADVREIPEFRRLPVSRGRKPRLRRRHESDAEDAFLEFVAGDDELDLSLLDEYVEWRRPDQPKDLARRLHRGDFSVQETVDLHGMIRDEALAALSGFLLDARRRGLYCVKIIHGRGLRSPGEPVLRSAVREWLVRGPYRRRIRAFSTARGRDGGLGAVYVLFQK